MTTDTENMRADMRTENKKFVLQPIAAAAALLASGAGLATLFLHLAGRV